MPFREVGRMEQRVELLKAYDTGAFSVVELCASYGISRDTFYRWHARRESGDEAWFLENSHAPGCCPHRTPPELVTQVVALRRRFPRFGPKKIRAFLQREQPLEPWPAASTIGTILKRESLVAPRAVRRRALARGQVAGLAQEPNGEWCCDFKGWFRTMDRSRCDPLTITDSYSRYLVDVRVAQPSIEGVRPVFERAFRDHGLPQAIRCDNGSPFGSTGAGGLTKLSVWWLKLGIEPHFIPPSSPQDNGCHERMHRTLKAHTADPAAANLIEQQKSFDVFRRHFNEERPHEALNQAPPASVWLPSPRTMPESIEEPSYDYDHEVRRVRTSGEIKWRGERIFIGEALIGEPVGIVERDDELQLVRFAHVDLGVIDRSGRFLRFAPLRHRLREAQEAPDTSKVSGINPV